MVLHTVLFGTVTYSLRTTGTGSSSASRSSSQLVCFVYMRCYENIIYPFSKSIESFFESNLKTVTPGTKPTVVGQILIERVKLTLKNNN
jgi:hypothetical protein